MPRGGEPQRPTDEGADPATRAKADDEFFDGSLAVGGSVAAEMSWLSSLDMELLVGTGRADDRRLFLTPLIDLELDGQFVAKVTDPPTEQQDGGGEDGPDTDNDDDDDEEEQHRVSLTLSFDNVAYAFEHAAKRYRRLMTTLIDMSSGKLTPVPGRIAFSTKALRTASLELAATAEHLQGFLGKLQEGTVDPASPGGSPPLDYGD